MYFFQLLGIDCIQGDEVMVCVCLFLVLDLVSIDSLCVDVVMFLLYQSQNVVGFVWLINDSLLYEVEILIYIFVDIGWYFFWFDVVFEFGCVDFVSIEVYVFGLLVM